MIKLFRNIRQKLITEGKVTNYMKYAIGEIVLVMIGILLALQVNNWNNDQKEKKLEKRFLSNLIQDLEADSVTIASSKKVSDEQVRTKQKLVDYFKGQSFSKDSLVFYFNGQWQPVYNFAPILTTLEEMKSTGNIGVISDLNLRRKILSTYNSYQVHINEHEGIYNRLQEEFWKNILSKLPNLSTDFIDEKLDHFDIETALRDFEIKNRLMLNHANGMNRGINELQNINNQLLSELRIKL
jgi:hypothetical protein